MYMCYEIECQHKKLLVDIHAFCLLTIHRYWQRNNKNPSEEDVDAVCKSLNTLHKDGKMIELSFQPVQFFLDCIHTDGKPNHMCLLFERRFLLVCLVDCNKVTPAR